MTLPKAHMTLEEERRFTAGHAWAVAPVAAGTQMPGPAGAGDSGDSGERHAPQNSRSCGCAGMVGSCARCSTTSTTSNVRLLDTINVLLPGVADREAGWKAPSGRNSRKKPRKAPVRPEGPPAEAPPPGEAVAGCVLQPLNPAHSNLPGLPAVCGASWPTMMCVPAPLVAEWAQVFCEELRNFNAFPSAATLARVMLSTKAILAAPLRGGRQRASTSQRLVAKRLALWRDGKISELWADVQAAWQRKPQAYKKRPGDPERREATMGRARMFAGVGLPGKACRLLCSRGVADPEDVMDNIYSLFPNASGDAITPPIAEDVDVDLTDVRPILKGLQRGLAAGPSGLRADYLLQVLARNSSFCKRKLPLVDELTGALTTFIRLAVSGRFTSDLAQWLCAGRVVPCCKKDGGLRPVVVGELHRSIVCFVCMFCG